MYGCCKTCVTTKVPLTEISVCVRAPPVIIRGSISNTDLASLVITAHPEIIPCSDQFPMIVENRKHVWVTINRRVTQTFTPTSIHEKVSKIAED